MAVLWAIWEFISTAMDIGLFLYLVHRKLPERKFRWWLDGTVIITYVSLINWLNVRVSYGFVFGVLFALYALYALAYKKGSVFSRLFWPAVSVFIAIAANFVIEIIVTISPHISYEDHLVSSSTRFQTMALYMLLTAVAVFFVARKRGHSGQLTRSLQLVMALIALFSIVTSGVLMDFAPLMQEQASIYTLMAAALLIMTIGLLIFFDHLGQKTEENIALEQRVLQTKLEQSHYENIQNLYKDMRDWRHDFHNHIKTIGVLLARRQYDELTEYIATMGDDVALMYTVVNTGNVALDAVITSKLVRAHQNEVPFEIAITGQITRVVLTDTALCALAGNLLDNAIEAACKLPKEKRWVKLTTEIQGTIWHLDVSNSSNGVYVQERNALRSSKREAGHGIGIRRVRELAEEGGGFCDFQPSPERFDAGVMLPLTT